jgi:uncharacterized SAM-binding protein YcdF (DUF218 family)
LDVAAASQQPGDFLIIARSKAASLPPHSKTMNLAAPFNPFVAHLSRANLTVLIPASLLVLWFFTQGAARLLIVSAPLAHADAIVVLSGSAALEERNTLAAEFYRQGRAPKIILTNDNQRGGWSSAEQRNPFFYERAFTLLRNSGIPSEAIEVVPQPISSTRDEALRLHQYAESRGLKSLLVVTSAYHTRRALWTLRRTFANTGITIGLEGVPPGWQSPSPATWWLYRRGWQMVPTEYVKLIYYWLSY